MKTGAGGMNYNEWVQTSNPATAVHCIPAQGFSPIFVAFPHWNWPSAYTLGTVYFAGLKASCIGNQNNWYYMSGAQDKDSYTQYGLGHTVGWGQLPGPTGPFGAVYVQQLWAVTGNVVRQCPGGTANPLNGSSSASACVECAAGTFARAGASACSACPAGSFCASSGMNASVPCAPGFFAIAGSTNCTICPAGSYNSVSGLSFCFPCRAGFVFRQVLVVFLELRLVRFVC